MMYVVNSSLQKNGRRNWIVSILYELTQPAKQYFWKLYHCACFCWRENRAPSPGKCIGGAEINLFWPSEERPLQVFGVFFSPKTFGHCTLKFLSKRCAQVRGDGRKPAHAPKGICAALLRATYSAVRPGLPRCCRGDLSHVSKISLWGEV